MKLLSVDFDFFFPPSIEWDWGHQESRFFTDIVWNFRVMDRNMVTREFAKDAYVPSGHNDFWQNVVASAPKMITVADSHLVLYERLRDIISEYDYIDVVNIDAHNDFGENWNEIPIYINCGNWALCAIQNKMMHSYTLYYPEWRRKMNGANIREIDEMIFQEYGLPAKDYYDEIFICRSGSWTPPWADKEFINFVEYWKDFDVWKNAEIGDGILDERQIVNIPKLNDWKAKFT